MDIESVFKANGFVIGSAANDFEYYPFKHVTGFNVFPTTLHPDTQVDVVLYNAGYNGTPKNWDREDWECQLESYRKYIKNNP